MSLRIRRGLSTDIPTPLEGELLYTTDNGNLYVGFYDQAQDAVIPKLTSASLVDDSNPTLSANLDLGGNNILGTGNINIDGTITATGDINLGDGAEDNVIVGGVINSSLIPSENSLYDLGDEASAWRNGYFNGVEVSGELTVESCKTTRIVNDASSVLYDGVTDTISSSNIDADNITTDLVLYQDSTSFLDGSTRTISVDKILINDSNSITSDPNSNRFLVKDDNWDWAIEDKWPLFELQGLVLSSVPYRTQSTGFQSSIYVSSTFRGDYDNKQSLQLGDQVGLYTTQAYIGNPGSEEELFVGFAGTRIEQSSETGNSYPCSFVLGTYDYQSNITEAVLNSRGVFSAPILKTGIYADGTERDNQVGTPTKGMIVFNDTSGTFQGYNGTSWVDLS